MSCYISKQLRLGSSFYLNLSDHYSYNNIANVIIWNSLFAIPIVIIALLLWSTIKVKIFGRVLSCLKGGETLIKVGHSIRVITAEHEGSTWSRFRRGFSKWICLDRNYLTEVCKESGYFYISFQRFVIKMEAVLALVSLTLILPVNLMLGSIYPQSTFAATTMSNIDTTLYPEVHWLHLIMSVGVLPFVLACMRHFLAKIAATSNILRPKVRRTLYLSKLPPDLRTSEAIRNYFRDRYPGSGITNIIVNSQVASLSTLANELDLTRDIVRICKSGQPLREKMFPRLCGFCYEGKEERKLALDFYTAKESKIKDDLNQEINRIATKPIPLDSAFAHVETLDKANLIMLLHNHRLGSRRFNMSYAPDLEDILWDMMTTTTYLRLKRFLVDTFWLITILLLFNADRLTRLVETLLYINYGENSLSKLFDDYPIMRNAWNLILAEVWAFLVTLLWSQGYWTDTRRLSGFLVRHYIALFTTLYLVPILNIDAIWKVVLSFITGDGIKIQWECIFSEDNGAYYINNLIIMSLIGCGITLLRISAIFFQGFALLSSSSWSEAKARIYYATYDMFKFDFDMAYFMLNFTITCSMITTSPLVSIFGLLYSVAKHLLDSYFLISGAYKTADVDIRPLYHAVIGIVTFGALLSQVNTTLCIFMCGGPSVNRMDYSVVKASVVLILVTMVVIIHQFQSNQRWPFRITPKKPIFDERSHTVGPEPIYRHPLLNWRNLSGTV